MAAFRGGARSLYAMVVGAVYLTVGGLEVATWLLDVSGRSGAIPGGRDPLGGLMLLLVGIVLLQGRRELAAGIREGIAFVYFGILLGLLFAGIQLLEIGGGAVDALVKGTGWAPASHLGPAVWLGPLPLVGLAAWRTGFRLGPRSSTVASSGGPEVLPEDPAIEARLLRLICERSWSVPELAVEAGIGEAILRERLASMAARGLLERFGTTEAGALACAGCSMAGTCDGATASTAYRPAREGPRPSVGMDKSKGPDGHLGQGPDGRDGG